MTTVHSHDTHLSSGHIFRPESLDHFKDAARDLAWLVGQPLHASQEVLARVYGFGSMHELSQVLKRQGEAGPFEARFGVDPHSPEDDILARNERRIARLIGGAGWLKEDKHWLVFELGLFLRASEQRECAGKVRHVLSSQWDGWLPTISGRPLGWRAWKCKWWTPDFELASGWEAAFVRPAWEWEDIHWANPVSTEASLVGPHRPWTEMVWANPADMMRRAGYEHGKQLHLVLVDDVPPEAPEALGGIDFFMLAQSARLPVTCGWEGKAFKKWATHLAAAGRDAVPTSKVLQDFVDRPSKSTAAASGLDRVIHDAAAVREHWAFEAMTAELETNYLVRQRPGLCLRRVRLGEQFEVVGIATRGDRQPSGCCVWRLDVSVSKVEAQGTEGGPRLLRPVAAAVCSVVEPFQETEAGHVVCTMQEWYSAHRLTEASADEAGAAVEQIGVPLLHMEGLFDWIGKSPQTQEILLFNPVCVVEVGQLVLADESVETLRALFEGLVGMWGGNWMFDGWEQWGQPLKLGGVQQEDRADIFEGQRRFIAEIAPPAVIVVEVVSCGGTWVHGRDKNQKLLDWTLVERFEVEETERVRLAQTIMEATRGLGVDLIVTDVGTRLSRTNGRQSLFSSPEADDRGTTAVH